MKSILTGVNYFAGWWKPLPNKWRRHDSSLATDQKEDWRPEFPERLPLLGEYNCQETMDREIEAATNHGIDFFPILWYYNEPNSEREPNSRFLNRALDEFTASPFANRMSFFIEFCNHNPFEVTTDQQWQECLDSWEKYITHPSYMKVDGRAIFKVFGAQHFIDQNGGDIDRCIAQLDSIRALFLKHGMDVIIGGGLEGIQSIGVDHPIANVFDFTCCYMDVPLDLPQLKEDYPYEMIAEFARDSRRAHSRDAIPHMPYVPAGWNPGPWPDERARFDLPNRAQWRAVLEEVKEDLSTLPNLGLPCPDGSLQPAFNCYAWNEFGEGGIVAPTHITGYMKLEEIRRTFKPETVKKEAELQPA
ncbi:glycoside hydrolase family 71/99 protein [Pontiella sulfatireligans]|uniref:Glycoside hydrolase family 42 N-terminal domain-containing protein n=1 Tax=Pontiella sulfatireligans TaxID=2750658 RepID=A0A6C2USW9_9BACT|nr:hypothetical protein [Pontiella sulfatireligans]VGO21996.1 hypothetical protein SCARR_04076 [Pontiella sulfatireligans]